MLWVIHLSETDGQIILWPCKDMEEVEDYVQMCNLHRYDYAIIRGERLKRFGTYVNDN